MFQNAVIVRKVIAHALLLLIAAGILMPVSGGLCLLRHRVARQSALMGGKTSWRPVDITLPEALASRYFRLEQGELEYGGLRYDVVKCKKEGAVWRLKAVPDLKESAIRKAAGKVLFPGASHTDTYGFNALYYRGETPIFIACPLLPEEHKSLFFCTKVAEKPGFKGNVSPPPEFVRV